MHNIMSDGEIFILQRLKLCAVQEIIQQGTKFRLYSALFAS